MDKFLHLYLIVVKWSKGCISIRSFGVYNFSYTILHDKANIIAKAENKYLR